MKVDWGYHLFCITVFGVSNIVLSAKYEYQFRFLASITPRELDKVETVPASDVQEHICELTEEEKLNICEEVLKDPMVEDGSIKLMENTPVLPRLSFDINVSRYSTAPPVTLSACMCPTNPPVYLKDESSGNQVYVHLCQEDTYSEVMEKINNLNKTAT